MMANQRRAIIGNNCDISMRLATRIMYQRITSTGVAIIAMLLGVLTAASPAHATQTAEDGTINRGIVVSIPEETDNLTMELSLPSKTIFSISLRENPSTGYSWYHSAATGSGRAVKYLGTDYIEDPNREELTGVGGTRYFRFKTAYSGKMTTITFKYDPPGTQDEPAKTIILRITVQ